MQGVWIVLLLILLNNMLLLDLLYTHLKIWSADLTTIDEEANEDGSSGSKKAKNSTKATTRIPLMTLAGKMR